MSSKKGVLKGAVQVVVRKGETKVAALARTQLSGSLAGSFTTARYLTMETVDYVAIEEQLRLEAEQVRNGDLSSAEAMLICQAHSLQAIFTNMANRAALNFGEYLNAAETYMRLALKAQAQCRSTLETLAEIKYPRHTAFIKQQNNAHNQQVNNYAGAENQKPTNELKAVTHEPGERLDSGATTKAGAGDPQLATVESVNGTEDAGRQAAGKPQRAKARRTVAGLGRSTEAAPTI